uniref:Gustatory receptor n=1 Tax=Glossina brevipalpis TaxID=37001 RepID=A0A1A9X4F3_9MUSC
MGGGPLLVADTVQSIGRWMADGWSVVVGEWAVVGADAQWTAGAGWQCGGYSIRNREVVFGGWAVVSYIIYNIDGERSDDGRFKASGRLLFSMFRQKENNKILVSKISNKILEINNESNQNQMNSLESQFFRALRPLLIISEILVCAPIGLRKLHNQPNTSTVYKKCLQILWGLTIYIAVAHGVYKECFLLKEYLPTLLLPFFLINTSYTLPNVILQTSLIQYYALIYVINKRMQLLYQLTEQTLKQSVEENIFDVQQRLRFLRGLYADMEEFTKHSNDAFAIPILLFFMASLKSLSFYIFNIYKYLGIWTELALYIVLYAVVEICWQFSRVFLILHFNQGIRNQKKLAATLFTSFRCLTERLEPTITRFIMQLSADPRNYIICGIIPLNMNVLMTMFFPVSALFIFLVQYDITYEALMSAKTEHQH